MSHSNFIPTDLSNQLLKASSHVKAAERCLWRNASHGLERGRQAAEAALAVLAHASSMTCSTSLSAFLKGIAAAEGRILNIPFPAPPCMKREELTAGLARKRSYIESIQALIEEVEDMVADRYIPLHAGQWARLPDNNTGILLARFGFAGYFFIPSIAEENPDASLKSWSLDLARIEPLESVPSMRLKSPGYYWLAEAKRRWRYSKKLATSEEPSVHRLYGSLTLILDAAAKAWLIEAAPADRQVIWSYGYAEHTLKALELRASENITTPLMEALLLSDNLYREAINKSGNMPLDWRHRVDATLLIIKGGLRSLASELRNGFG